MDVRVALLSDEVMLCLHFGLDGVERMADNGVGAAEHDAAGHGENTVLPPDGSLLIMRHIY